MFRSRIRNLVLPQLEHSRLAGMLAWQWGNEDFDRPEIDFEGFARGVALHDWHYGAFDNYPLGETTRAEWLAIANAGVMTDYDDPVVDAIAKYHLRRLMKMRGVTGTGEVLFERLESKLRASVDRSPYPAEAFAWADRLTRFCDSVAFHYGFENRGLHGCPVGGRTDSDDETGMTFEIADDSLIRFDPWPFAVSEFCIQIMFYCAAGYPGRLKPRVTLVRCLPGQLQAIQGRDSAAPVW